MVYGISRFKGYCQRCQCVHQLESDLSFSAADKLYCQLKREGCFDFERPLSQRDPFWSLNRLYERTGQMFGVMLAQDSMGNIFEYKSFSGSHYAKFSLAGWVPPVIDEAKYTANLSEANAVLHPLNRLIDDPQTSCTQREQLKAKRKAKSQIYRERYLDYYTFKNFRGETASLKDIHLQPDKIHTATGDCAGIKLLNLAAHKGLTPLAITEFYLGNSSRDGIRHCGQVYDACKERCEQLLGWILCGLPS